MLLATLVGVLVVAFMFYNVWAIGKFVWSLVSIAESMQRIARHLDQQRPSL